MKSNKLMEFALINDIYKFNSNSDILFLSDDKPVFNFWRHYKNEILASNDKYSKMIQKQYWLYKNRHLIEFAKEQNLDKFTDSKNELKFFDGTCMARWFRSHGVKEKILNSNDKYSLKIQKDYAIYRKRKLIEFFKINDLNKFYSKSNMRFKDGSDVYRWWVINKTTIMNNNDEYSVKIQEQYEKYKSKKFVDKFYEFILLEDDKKFKNLTKEELHFKDGSSVYAWYGHNRNKVKRMVNFLIKEYESKNVEVPSHLLNKVYLDEDTIKKYGL